MSSKNVPVKPEHMVTPTTDHLMTTFQPLNLSEIQRYAEVFYKSGLFNNLRSVFQAIVQIQAGQELGIGPYAAMRGMVAFTDRPPEPNATLCAALIRKSGIYDYVVEELSAEKCTVAIYRKVGNEWRLQGRASFGKHEAEIAEIWEKGKQKKLAEKWNYRSWGEDMMFARAMTRAARRYCPDVTFGLGIGAAIEADIALSMEETASEPQEGPEIVEQVSEDLPEENPTLLAESASDKMHPASDVPRRACYARAKRYEIPPEIWRAYAFTTFRVSTTNALERDEWAAVYILLKDPPALREWAGKHVDAVQCMRLIDKSLLPEDLEITTREVLAEGDDETIAQHLKQLKNIATERIDAFSDQLTEEEQYSVGEILKHGTVEAVWRLHRDLAKRYGTKE